MIQRKNVDISELYDLFMERKECYFVCCDICGLIPINNIARKAGDLAIIEVMKRMSNAAGENDIVFRIGGDEFCIVTDHPEEEYAKQIAKNILEQNEQTFEYESMQIPLSLYVTITKFHGKCMKYNELFTELHKAIQDGKRD